MHKFLHTHTRLSEKALLEASTPSNSIVDIENKYYFSFFVTKTPKVEWG
jgi:hypothetical protein